jgi:hypothetical protein
VDWAVRYFLTRRNPYLIRTENCFCHNDGGGDDDEDDGDDVDDDDGGDDVGVVGDDDDDDDDDAPSFSLSSSLLAIPAVSSGSLPLPQILILSSSRCNWRNCLTPQRNSNPASSFSFIVTEGGGSIVVMSLLLPEMRLGFVLVAAGDLHLGLQENKKW